MKAEPLVSIIIPTYNRAYLIGETLDSVLSQTYDNWECIIVDDGSTDYTNEVVSKYVDSDTRFQYHHRPNDRIKGANACRNYGFEISKGEFINWFDSDDLMMRNFVEFKVNKFQDGVDCVISKHQFIDEKGNLIGNEERTLFSSDVLDDFIVLNISWYLPDPMYKRSFLEKIELFDETLLKGQDRDFHIRWLQKKPSIVFVDDYLTQYRQVEHSISNNFEKKVLLSLYQSRNRQINTLLEANIKTSTRLFILKQQLKLYSYLWKIKGVTKSNYALFFKLGMLNMDCARWFFKYTLSVVSYYLTGRGYRFLKGK